MFYIASYFPSGFCKDNTAFSYHYNFLDLNHFNCLEFCFKLMHSCVAYCKSIGGEGEGRGGEGRGERVFIMLCWFFVLFFVSCGLYKIPQPFIITV